MVVDCTPQSSVQFAICIGICIFVIIITMASAIMSSITNTIIILMTIVPIIAIYFHHHDHPHQAGRLERLDLSYNNLKELDSATLASLPNLLVLKVNSTIQHEDHHQYHDHYNDHHQLCHPRLPSKPARSQGDLNIMATMTMMVNSHYDDGDSD